MADNIGNVEVDHTLCIGSASCVLIAPKVFKLNDESKAVVITIDGTDDATILEAAKSCPVNAIIVKDKNGNQLWPQWNKFPHNPVWILTMII